MKCPICKTKLNIIKVEREAVIPSGDKFFYEEKNYLCLSCSYQGALNNSSNLKSYIANRKLAVKESIKKIVSALHNRFENLLYIERTLDLPRRTLSRWKNSGESSTPSLLLLKMIETFPFLIDVAEKKFDRAQAQKIFLDAAENLKKESQTRPLVSGIKIQKSSGDGTPYLNTSNQIHMGNTVVYIKE